MFKHSVLISNKDFKEYNDWTEKEYTDVVLANYYGQKDFANYAVPVLGDAASAEFIRAPKYTGEQKFVKESVINRLINTTLQYEINRIMLVRRRKEQGVVNRRKIENFDTVGAKFVFFDFLNDHLDEIIRLKTSKNTEERQQLNPLVARLMEENFDKYAKETYERAKETGVINEKDGMPQHGIKDGAAEDMITEFVYNHIYATANIIALTTTDPAFMKDAIQFQKRFKQTHAPGDHVNVNATFDGVPVGRKSERYMVLEDVNKTTEQALLDKIVKIIDDSENLSPEDKARIKASYGWYNHTDEKGKK
jgi:hypothetical protein